MSGFGEAYPTWAEKTKAILSAVRWASGGLEGDWKFKKEAATLPDDNDAWFELRMGRILELGVDEVRYTDNIDPLTGLPDVNEPRLDVSCGQRQFMVEIRFFNRDQEQDVVAWAVADRTRARLRMAPARERWLDPVAVSIVELLQVFPMPSPVKVVDLRPQSEAVLEIDLTTVIAESDAAAVGTWIESVQITSDLKNPGGVSLDPAIQLQNEVMP